jgi:hypothetical protein
VLFIYYVQSHRKTKQQVTKGHSSVSFDSTYDIPIFQPPNPSSHFSHIDSTSANLYVQEQIICSSKILDFFFLLINLNFWILVVGNMLLYLKYIYIYIYIFFKSCIL